MSSRWTSSGVVRALELGAAITGAATAATVAGLAAQRKVARNRARALDDHGFGSVHGPVRTLVTPDGVRLHVEVDEPDDGAPGAAPDAPTLVFVHGYLLTLDCWHFQRLALRGRHRMVFYDQRSHGRSTASDPTHSTLEKLGEDLRQVLDEVAEPGPVVLVGHSMGGMTLMSLAEQYPGVIADRVAGAAFLATSGEVGTLLPGPAGRVVDAVEPIVFGSLAKLTLLVDASRRNTSFALTRRLAFGGSVPHSLAVFVDQMISSTPSQVLWDFLPSLRLHRRYVALAAYSDVASLVVGGARDAILPLSHAARLARELPDTELLELPDAGHMLQLERPDEVTAALERLLDRDCHRAARRPGVGE